jgi:hypothetical protein
VTPLGQPARVAIVLSAKKMEQRNMEQNETTIEMVCVRWADAHAGEGHWSLLEDEDSGEHIVETVGLLIPPTEGGKKEHLTIAQSVSPDGFVDHVIFIPVSMSRSVTFLTPRTNPLTM